MLDPKRQDERPSKGYAIVRGVQHNTRPSVYLFWSGEIYGPATEEEVLRGILTSWFDQSALYWHEGLKTWRPIHEFARSTEHVRTQRPNTPPTLDSHFLHHRLKAGTNCERRSLKPRSRKAANPGFSLFAIGFALFAIMLIVGILLLLMMI